jgi:cyclase
MRQLLPRVIPCLLLRNSGLIKTVKFKNPKYLGDPCNTVKIFNDKEVDELVILDTTATLEKKNPSFNLIFEIVSEAFMPVAYGGGIRNLEAANRILSLGVEKIVINTYAVENPSFVTEAARRFGSSSVVVCIDAKTNFFGKSTVHIKSGRKSTHIDPVDHAIHMEQLGAGELIVNSIDRDGTMSGYDLELIRMISSQVHIPVIACGGAGTAEHLGEAVHQAGASAVAAGSLFVFHGRHRAVLINFPEQQTLREIFTHKTAIPGAL